MTLVSKNYDFGLASWIVKGKGLTGLRMILCNKQVYKGIKIPAKFNMGFWHIGLWLM